MKFRMVARGSKLNITLFVSAAAYLFSTSVFGQNEDIEVEVSKDTEVLEEVVVTGSHLKRTTNYDGRAPIQVLDREAMTAGPVTSVLDLVRNLPVSSGVESQNELNGLVGTSQINIRGLGLGSTLTLLNGRRGGIATSGDGGANLFFDINQLPLAMIDRIEILTDGASATYGAQAVAGVANVITRKGFEGLELKVNAESAQSNSYGIDMAMGVRGDRSMFNVYASGSHKDRVERDEYDWLEDRIGGFLNSGTGAPGSYQRVLTTTPPSSPGENFSYTTGDKAPDAFCGTGDPSDENYDNSLGFLRFGGTTCGYSFFDQLSATQQEDRLQIFSELDYDISENAKFFAELGASHNVSKGTFGSSLYNHDLLIVPGSHPYNFYVADGEQGLAYRGPDASGNFSGNDAAMWANGDLQAVDVRAVTRLLGQETQNGGSNPGEARYQLDYQRLVLGFEADINEDWSANVSYVRALASSVEEVPFEWIPENVLAALSDGSFNPFGTALATPDFNSPKPGTTRSAGNDQIVKDSLHATRSNNRRTDTSVVEAIVTGNLFSIGGGDVAMALGLQNRTESLKENLDSLRSSGSSGRNITEAAISGSETTNSVFAEWQLPFTDDFEVQAALRYEDFEQANVSTTVPKISARWNINDRLSVRGSWGESFQAPNILQTTTTIATGTLQDSVNASGSCVGIKNSGISNIVNVISTGSDILEPQSADAINLGIILEPIDDLRLGLEYWSFDYQDLITKGVSAQAKVINDCNDDGVANDPSIQRAANGIIRSVTTEFVNVGSVETDGLDLTFDYLLDSNIGEFKLGTVLSFVNSFDIIDSSGATDGVGSRNFLNSFRTIPELKFNTTFGWTRDAHQANLSLHYIDGYVNDANDEKVSSMTTVDLQYRYRFGEFFETSGSVLTLGVRNIFDRDPPSLGQGQRPGFDQYTHDQRGRGIYASFTHTFQ